MNDDAEDPTASPTDASTPEIDPEALIPTTTGFVPSFREPLATSGSVLEPAFEARRETGRFRIGA